MHAVPLPFKEFDIPGSVVEYYSEEADTGDVGNKSSLFSAFMKKSTLEPVMLCCD